MPIPDVSKEKIIEALTHFDKELSILTNGKGGSEGKITFMLLSGMERFIP